MQLVQLVKKISEGGKLTKGRNVQLPTVHVGVTINRTRPHRTAPGPHQAGND